MNVCDDIHLARSDLETFFRDAEKINENYNDSSQLKTRLKQSWQSQQSRRLTSVRVARRCYLVVSGAACHGR